MRGEGVLAAAAVHPLPVPRRSACGPAACGPLPLVPPPPGAGTHRPTKRGHVTREANARYLINSFQLYTVQINTFFGSESSLRKVPLASI